jgi:hypothetical protein
MDKKALKIFIASSNNLVFTLIIYALIITFLSNLGIDTLLPSFVKAEYLKYPAANNIERRKYLPNQRNSIHAAYDKMILWDLKNGPHLRGANIAQRRVYPDLDGPTFMGSGPVGPPFTQADFNRLAAMGANYVNISHPGLFSEIPPYTLDKNIQNSLDKLLDMIARADMFAVITFRSGPGRSEFAIHPGDAGSWFPPHMIINTVWQSQAAQNAWAQMWHYTAQRYRDNPIVVGYDLMCEPNSNDYLNIWNPEEFYQSYGNTLHDWNRMYPPIVAAIREVDAETPILIGCMCYSSINWLPYLKTTEDSCSVYIVHQYDPNQYTFQEWYDIRYGYPGVFDTDWDGVNDQFNRAWLNNLLTTVDNFVAKHGVSVGVNEFGVKRWVPGAADFMDDQMDLFERRGWNHALWEWSTSWEPYRKKVDAFNFLHGPDPHNHNDIASSALIEVIRRYWSYNTSRPSNVTTKKIIIRK